MKMRNFLCNKATVSNFTEKASILASYGRNTSLYFTVSLNIAFFSDYYNSRGLYFYNTRFVVLLTL